MFRKIKKILYRSIENRDISYKKLQDMIKKNPNIVLLDVRSNQEYLEGHLNNSINIPLYNLGKEALQKLQDKQKIIITYCSTGNRSKRAKEILEQMNYENIYNLKEGLDGIK